MGLREAEGGGEHVLALDGLRGVAILAVMLFHQITACGYGSDAWVTRKLIGLAVNLWTGVDLFFGLSGFLITGILRRARAQPSCFKNFYVRRALRIFPLYYAALVVIFVLLPRGAELQIPDVQRIQGGPFWWGHWTALGPGFSALGVGAAGLVVFATAPRGNPLQRLLRLPWLRAFGKYS